MESVAQKAGSAGEVARTLRRAISQGTYGRGEFLPPLRRLADESGVAYLTASRAMKMLSREGLIAAEPRKGYRVLRAGSATSSRRAVFGFVSGSDPSNVDVWNETHKAILAGFQCASGARGLGILAVNPGSMTVEDTARAVREAGVAGVAMDSDRPELVAAMRAEGLRVVLVDAYTYETQVDGVVQDNFQGGFLAGEYLVRRGHREAAWFGLSYDSVHSRERLGGAVAGLRAGGAGLAPDFEIRVSEQTSGIPSEEARREARAMLTAPNRPRAILALWQSCGNAVLGAARELGLRQGRDFDLVTWGIEENRNEVYALRFGADAIPPMACWSARRMAELALERLTAPGNGDQRFVRLNVPMKIYEG